jgi:hypothetical protein
MTKAELDKIKMVALDLVNSTKFVEDVAALYKLPVTIRAHIIDVTSTIEERNMGILNACMIRFIAELIKCDDSIVVSRFCADKFEELFPIFILATLELLNGEINEKERV